MIYKNKIVIEKLGIIAGYVKDGKKSHLLLKVYYVEVFFLILSIWQLKHT